MSAKGGDYVPDLILERYHLDELPRQEKDRVERLLHGDQLLRDRLKALEASDEEIARQRPADWLAQRVRERLAARAPQPRVRPQGLRRIVLATALTGAALVAVVAVPWGSFLATGESDRIKGLSPSLIVYRRTAEGSETLANGAVARAGDLLRLGYASAGRGYGVILSIDGRGVVTQHLPPDGPRAASLRSGGTVLLDQAYELDDAPAWECFYFVTADHAFDVGPIMDAARRAASRGLRSPPAALSIPREFSQSMFSVQKEVRP